MTSVLPPLCARRARSVRRAGRRTRADLLRLPTCPSPSPPSADTRSSRWAARAWSTSSWTTRGLVGDRRYAVVDGDGKLSSGKDSRRFRRRDQVFSYSAGTSADGRVEVRLNGSTWVVGDDDLDAELSRAFGDPRPRAGRGGRPLLRRRAGVPRRYRLARVVPTRARRRRRSAAHADQPGAGDDPTVRGGELGGREVSGSDPSSCRSTGGSNAAAWSTSPRTA